MAFAIYKLLTKTAFDFNKKLQIYATLTLGIIMTAISTLHSLTYPLISINGILFILSIIIGFLIFKLLD